MTTHELTNSDINAIKKRGIKTIETNGSIVFRMEVFYRFNDVTITIPEVCGIPYNKGIEIHGKLKNQNGINNFYSFCEARTSNKNFEELIK